MTTAIMMDPSSGAAHMTDAAVQHEIEQFLYLEAALLDDREWDRWEQLFTEDGMYWAPLAFDQTDPLNHASIFYEDAMMREVRRRRLDHARAWSQHPLTRTARTVGNVMILAGTAGSEALTVRSTFQMTEWRGRRDLRQLAGRYTHSLVRVDGDWRIALKRIDLINCDGVHYNFEVFV